MRRGVAPGATSGRREGLQRGQSTSCSGVALLQGMDFALDPNGDGDTDDAVDVINMSLGSPYGQASRTTSSLASANAVEARRGRRRLGRQQRGQALRHRLASIAPGVICGRADRRCRARRDDPARGQSRRPRSPATTATRPPSTGRPSPPDVTGDVALHRPGCPTATALTPDPAGPILTHRPSARSRSSIAARATSARRSPVRAARGGDGVLIGLVAPGDAVSFSTRRRARAACRRWQSSRFISQRALDRSQDDRRRRWRERHGLDSRSGPRSHRQHGRLVVARADACDQHHQAGDRRTGRLGLRRSRHGGTATTPFGGTSGAAPMVAGSAALLLQAYPNRSPAEIKAILMNTRRDRRSTPIRRLLPGVLAPITRIGGGEVRVDRAIAGTGLRRSTRELSPRQPLVRLSQVSGADDGDAEVRVQNYGRVGQAHSPSRNDLPLRQRRSQRRRDAYAVESVRAGWARRYRGFEVKLMRSIRPSCRLDAQRRFAGWQRRRASDGSSTTAISR